MFLPAAGFSNKTGTAELHQLAGDAAQGNGLGVLERAARELIALTGTLMGGYSDDGLNIFYRLEARANADLLSRHWTTN